MNQAICRQRDFKPRILGARRGGGSGGIARRHHDARRPDLPGSTAVGSCTPGSAGGCGHTPFFERVRADDHHWVVESELRIQRKHVQLGLQENRVTKYHDGSLPPRSRCWASASTLRRGRPQEHRAAGNCRHFTAAHGLYAIAGPTHRSRWQFATPREGGLAGWSAWCAAQGGRAQVAKS